VLAKLLRQIVHAHNNVAAWVAFMDFATVNRNPVSESAEFFFRFTSARLLRASSVSRYDLHVATIPAAAQAITALVLQCEAIHEGIRAREFIILHKTIL
jgi:hypothetical protein